MCNTFVNAHNAIDASVMPLSELHKQCPADASNGSTNLLTWLSGPDDELETAKGEDFWHPTRIKGEIVGPRDNPIRPGGRTESLDCRFTWLQNLSYEQRTECIVFTD